MNGRPSRCLRVGIDVGETLFKFGAGMELLIRYLRALSPSRIAIVASDGDRESIRAVVDDTSPGVNCEFYSEDEAASIPVSVDMIVLMLPDLPSSLRAHAECREQKEQGVPVVFGRSRDVFTSTPPQANATGITYAGMFRLVANVIPKGDLPEQPAFAEFGVFDGRTFTLAYHCFKGFINRFFALDTFRGIRGSAQIEEPFFQDGGYFSNLETFAANLEIAGVDRDCVDVIQGDFCEMSHDDVAAIVDGSVVVAHVDCDVFKPARAALELLAAKLHDHAMLLFDDYDTMWAANDRGERAAVRDWLNAHPEIELTEYRRYAAVGRAFMFTRHRRD